MVLLRKLFGNQLVEARLPSLESIYRFTSTAWENQADALSVEGVRYLLIGEAPPWSEGNEVVYFYNERCKPRSLMNAVRKAFFGEETHQKMEIKEVLQRLAKQGFLLIDSIPFAMDYSNGENRGKGAYADLVRFCASSYLLRQMESYGIRRNDHLKVAFSLKKNAEIIIDYFSDGFMIPGRERKIQVTEENIATNKANYPCGNKLREIYSL